MERRLKRFFGVESRREPRQDQSYPPQPYPPQAYAPQPYAPQCYPPQQNQYPYAQPAYPEQGYSQQSHLQHSYPQQYYPPQSYQQQHHHDRQHAMSRKVFAHYMVGICDGQTQDQWATECNTAKEAGIDGFALNIGPNDYWTETQLRNAYAAAGQVGGFVLFISFDMACGEWSVQQVVGLINTYKDSPAQLRVEDKAFVSTFEGPGWADNWAAVRQQTGDIFLVPDWSSLGAHGVGKKLGTIDGAFSWGAWPQPGQTQMNTGEDQAYKGALQGKKYMMGVSPYFYTNLPQWNKNWYSSSESLWFDRWQQVLEIMPDYVQIITWNDYGESSYISDTNPGHVVQGADPYINGYDHSGFRAILPYFIRAYKAGDSNIPLGHEDRVVAWYRTTPVHCGSDGGTVWGQGGSESAANGARDVISIVALTNGPESVTVDIGGQSETFDISGSHPSSYFEMPFNGRYGPVSIKIGGRSTTGPAISDECPPCGHVVFNSAVISL